MTLKELHDDLSRIRNAQAHIVRAVDAVRDCNAAATGEGESSRFHASAGVASAALKEIAAHIERKRDELRRVIFAAGLLRVKLTAADGRGAMSITICHPDEKHPNPWICEVALSAVRQRLGTKEIRTSSDFAIDVVGRSGRTLGQIAERE